MKGGQKVIQMQVVPRVHWALLAAICTRLRCENLSWGEEDVRLQVKVTVPLLLRKWVPGLASDSAQALELFVRY